MKKRKIELTVETAERWYNGCDKELQQLALQAFPELEKIQFPNIWEELQRINGFFVTQKDSTVRAVILQRAITPNKNVFSTREQAEASIALAQLSQLREVYRNGWVPDWNDDHQIKFCIEFYENKPHRHNFSVTGKFLSFQDEKTRDMFLHNFRDLIKNAKPLMQ